MPCRVIKPCIVLDCGRTNIKGRGLCARHYDNDYRVRTGKLEKERIQRRGIKVRHRRASRRAYLRGMDFSIKIELFEQLLNKGCHYCGTSLLEFMGYSLDRIDNSKGYTPDNVLPCCGTCNLLRSNTFTVEETEVMVSALVAYRKARTA